MSRTEHALERRSRLLGVGLEKRFETLTHLLAPDGRKPYHTPLTEEESMVFWDKELLTPTGQAVQATMKPQDVLKLHVKLAAWRQKRAEAEMMGATDGEL